VTRNEVDISRGAEWLGDTFNLVRRNLTCDLLVSKNAIINASFLPQSVISVTSVSVSRKALHNNTSDHLSRGRNSATARSLHGTSLNLRSKYLPSSELILV
jgi:hypothetical protein